MNAQCFNTWSDFKNNFREFLPAYTDEKDVFKRYIFRGQARAEWPLTSSFDRVYSGRRAGSRDQIAKMLIAEFYEECARLFDWRYAIDDPRVLAMAQHHGLPTRLLDWTFSPYVAAYFAFSSRLLTKTEGGNIAIWAGAREEIEDKAPAGQLQIISVQDHENNRLGNQAGVFTFLKTNDSDLQSYLESPAVDLGHTLAKLEITGSEYRFALRDLILMGIHHGTIFPGREGIAHMITIRELLARED
jgi:hypothetical protein